MKVRIAWSVVGCLMMTVALLASCAPAAPPAEEKPAVPAEEKPAVPAEEKPTTPAEEKPTLPKEEVEMVKVSLTKADGTVVEKLVEKPRYGGIFTQGCSSGPLNFDETYKYIHTSPTQFLTNENLLSGAWEKGEAGTGEACWQVNIHPAPNVQAGLLATHWELIDEQTMILHIRKGVHFHNKPPVNGRELDAYDVEFSFNYAWTVPTCYHVSAYPREQCIESMKALDKWTFELKSKPGNLALIYEMGASHTRIIPHEVVEMYGDLSDWENACGTGPFMLVDYVHESSVTFARNPNYWMKDPLHPQNQLPYLDGVKWLTIPDPSTRLAALRTAKIDHQGGSTGGISWEEADSLIQSNPKLEYAEYYTGQTSALFWRLDTPPFDDIRVRRALSMAVDNQVIKEDFYGGKAELLSWPIGPVTELIDMYTPPDQLPESARELFEYNPEKAKQLLAEAGYPNGFNTEVVCYQPQVDLLSIVKAYWEDIGVNLELNVKEYGVYSSTGFSRGYKQMFMSGAGCTLCFRFLYTTPLNTFNYSLSNDQRIVEAKEAITAAYWDEPKRRQMMKDIVPYMLDQAYLLQFPAPYVYTFWQPWVKGYHGEDSVGYSDYRSFVTYIWIDQDLKKSMIGSR